MAESIKTNPEIESAYNFLVDKNRLVILTGAGISAGSGIPTYRDEQGNWQRSEPIQHQDFVTHASARKRYWLRSFAGWPAVANATPSPAHEALTILEDIGNLKLLVTQNVDRLHQRAGSHHVIDLHGRLDQVICLSCGCLFDRHAIQSLLHNLNPFLTVQGQLAPDGDADIESPDLDRVTPPTCDRCDGILKPDVVFFGDNVDRTIVQTVYDNIDDCDALLVIGSSLKVFSGYRFCRYAAEKGKPIASINPGVTRADDLMELTIRKSADDILPDLASRLIGQ